MTEQQQQQSPSSAAPEFLWKTLVGRSVFTYQAALLGENRSHLLDEQYIEGLCTEKKRITRSLNITFWLTLGLSWALLAQTAKLSEISFTLFGITFPAGFITLHFLLFTLAILFSLTCLRMLSALLIERLINVSSEERFGSAWKFYTAKFEADSLWVDLLNLHFGGYRSPSFHMLFTALTLLVVFSISIAQLIFVISAGTVTFLEVWSASQSFIDKAVAIASLTIILSSSLALIIAILIPLKFRWSS